MKRKQDEAVVLDNDSNKRAKLAVQCEDQVAFLEFAPPMSKDRLRQIIAEKFNRQAGTWNIIFECIVFGEEIFSDQSEMKFFCRH